MFQDPVIVEFSYLTQKAIDFSWLVGVQMVRGSQEGGKRESRKNSCIWLSSLMPPAVPL